MISQFKTFKVSMRNEGAEDRIDSLFSNLAVTGWQFVCVSVDGVSGGNAFYTFRLDAPER